MCRADELTDDAFVLAVPNDFTREWIEGHFLDLIGAAVRDATGHERRIQLSSSSARSSRRARSQDAPAQTRAPAFEHEPEVHVRLVRDRLVEPLRARGRARRRRGAGAGVQPALHLRRHRASARRTSCRRSRSTSASTRATLSVRYVTSETFMNDFINSLRDKRIEGFKQRYRTYDVLLIDDIQFFEHKERIQEEFFHTFNSLYEAGRQIVISSDRPPREIATLEERLRSRFEWGLITDIQPPDLETRIAILRKKVKTDGIHVPDPQVLTFIAGRISTNIRELEGALTRVVAFSSLTGRPMTVELAQDVLKDVFPQGEAPEVSIERIQERGLGALRPLAWRSSAATGARRTSSTRARSRCTSHAS